MPPERLGVDIEADQPDLCRYRGALAQWYLPYAIMSLNAYRPDGVDNTTADHIESCRDQDHKVQCPTAWQGSRLGADGRYTEANNDATGLFMESFKRVDERRVNERRATYVIAFRGTEWRSLADWRANLRWFMPFLRTRDQYPEARRTAVKWVARACEGLGQAYDRLDVVMTGHSLGGGLAQSAAYAVERALKPGIGQQGRDELTEEERDEQKLLAACDHEKVRVQTVAFDPSPVTGYRDEHPLPKCENPLSRECRVPIIMRLYEKGEVLSPARRLLSWFIPVWPNICEDRYAFTSGLPIGQHQMVRIASGLIWLAKQSGDPEATAIYERYCPDSGGTGSGLLLCIKPEFDCPIQKP